MTTKTQVLSETNIHLLSKLYAIEKLLNVVEQKTYNLERVYPGLSISLTNKFKQEIIKYLQDCRLALKQMINTYNNTEIK